MGMYSRAPLRAILLTSGAILALQSAALANPTGGTVTTGAASISNSKNATTVDQRSEGVVIDWSSFNIGNGQTTTFVQPNASAIAVNRIGSAKASQVLGTLDANGRIVLINGNGMLFGRNAQVNVGSLVATSTGGSDSDLLAGKFTQAGNQNASVINRGTITTASYGTVALVAPNVTNRGIVQAKLGTVALGAANAFTVDFKGDGLVSFAAQGDVNSKANATNTGRLSGATVSMTANAAEGMATGVVNAGGLIEAQGVNNSGGTIMLNAGNGTLNTTGTLNAAGTTGGGKIDTSGANVLIGGRINAGAGGTWTVDPENLVVGQAAATTIHQALAHGTDVTLQTTADGTSGPGTTVAGPGDIDIDANIVWHSSATLTLDSYNSIDVISHIKVTGTGTLDMTYNTGGGSGVLEFTDGGRAEFTDVSNGLALGILSIDGNSYTLVSTLPKLSNLLDHDISGEGYYALADSYNAKSDGNYADPPVDSYAPNGFAGDFEGLGNSLTDIEINSDLSQVGLFNYLTGTVENLHLNNVLVRSKGPDAEAGILAGQTQGGSIFNVTASGRVDTRNVAQAGGLVGSLNQTTVSDVTTSGEVNAWNNSQVGGLFGLDYDSVISDGSSSSMIRSSGGSQDGGLIGIQYGGSVAESFATGNVTETGTEHYGAIGGLDGENIGSGTVTESYATGDVDDLDARVRFVGGFVGVNGGAITDSYATGSVTGGAGADVGGFAGLNRNRGSKSSIKNSYSTGIVTGSKTDSVGGFVGVNDSDLEHDYWDISTSGISDTSQGAGNKSNAHGITGLTTAQFQSGLPGGFLKSIWAESPDINGGLPYLLALPPITNQ